MRCFYTDGRSRRTEPHARDADHLFVYGTLREGVKHPMHAVLANHADLIGEAVFQGRLYDLGAFPGVVPSDRPEDLVHGEVYHLRHPDRALRALDRYEGVMETGGTRFRRERADVTLKTGDVACAWIYVYNWPVRGCGLISSGDYLTLVTQDPSSHAPY